ncbi:MAG: FadR family transcriptional regulator [Actinobacteria bacterium]|nr:MAG: FadR family transcriptional regulator [Actinomycetota bacterium]
MMTGMEQTERRPRSKPKFRPARFASVIVEELAQQIVSGALAEGDVLPTEPALCEEFGFSRTVVREGLKLLEERGLVRVEQGRGTTVQPRSSWNLLDPDVLRIALEYDSDMSLLDDLISVRRVLEREMAAQAAGQLTDAELVELGDIIEQMEHAYDDYDAFRACDNAFHAIIMRASGNEVGLTIVRVIHRHGGATAPLAAGASKATLKRTAAEHRAILEALAEGDGELAGERISAHIEARWSERKSRRKGT